QPGDENGNYRYLGHFSYLKLEDIAQFVKLNPEPGIDFPILDKIELYGNLTDSYFIFDPALPVPEQIIIDSNINRLGIKSGHDKTMVTGLSGHLQGTIGQGIIKINSTSVELDLHSLFENPLAFYELNGDVKWFHDDRHWSFKTDFIEAHTTDFNSQFKGKIIIHPESSSPYTDILININNANIENVSRYTPMAIPEKVRNWMDNSLIAGNLTSLDIVLRGWLDDFPFDNKEGQFKIVANVHNATLDYHPEWMPVDGIDAELVIDENSIVVNASSGKILNADITRAQAVINELNADKPIIRIDGTAKGHTNDAIFVIQNSPLVSSSTLSKITKYDINGQITLVLGLDIPLHEDPVKVNGEITFQDAVLNSPSTGIQLDKITGTISFTEDSITSRELTANYFNQPVELGISSAHGNVPDISLGGIADNRFITAQLTHFFPRLAPAAGELNKRISGTCNWLATLSAEDPTVESNHNGILKITSSLSDLSIDLPAPLGKSADYLPLEISTIITETDQKAIDFEYGNVLSGHVELDNSLQESLTKAIFTFGEKTNSHELAQGITIDGQIEYLPLLKWFDLVNSSNVSISSGSFDTIQLDVTVSSLDFLDQVFGDVNIQLHKQQSDWNINFNGKDIVGDIVVPADTITGPLKASFNKINIAGNNTSDNDEMIDPGKLPPLQIQVAEFNYGTVELGQMILNTSTIENGMTIDSISFIKPDLTITGKGIWQLNGETELSEFIIRLNAEYLNSMLETFGYSVAAIEQGETSLTLDAHWDGSPTDFSFANISGYLGMDIGKGELLDIKPTAGRLFGLLSFQTLARRLSLDFTDLFSKGLAFDHIEGSFTIAGGNAYTNNLTMTGPSVNIDVTGRTGLVDQDYDQIVTVTPQFADSLPVASALFGPIGVGVGAVILLAGEMFKSIPEQIDRLLQYQYTIKGRWDEPIVEKYSGKSEASG
ncbi:MAG: TIGR02099 family protein, partial [Gammaproteobacteria bacterium]|nr:TIGR02099 family protein [Gammaproteobacteria bacterium]